MGQVTAGLAKLEIAVITGGTPGTYAELGYINIDSAATAEEAGTTNDFFVEQKDAPIYSRKVKGKTSMTATIADPVLATFQTVFGGTITGTGSAQIWEAPENVKNKEVALRVTPEVGYILNVDNTILSGQFNMPFGKNQLSSLPITFDFMSPVKLGGLVEVAE